MNDIIIRDNTIDILKGIGIVLVVMGHSGVPQWMYNFIYSFHMPLFFIASGWFLTTRLTTTVDFVKRKIKGIYCPFVKWSIIFLLLHNVFYHIGIINGFYGHNGIVAELYTKRDFLSNLLNIVFRMSGYDSFLLGAFWFMRALFIANIILFLGCTIMKKNGPESAKNMLQLTVLSAVWGGAFSWFQIQLPLVPQGGYREVMATFFVGIGYSLKRIECWKNKKLIPIMGFVVLALLSIISPTELIPKATFVQWVTIVVTGIIGFIVVYYVSISLSKRQWIVSRILNYIGQRTFYILTFHFLAFKVASLIKICIYDYDIRMIGFHPVIPPTEGERLYWVVYSAVAIILSLLLERIIYQISVKIRIVNHLIK